MRHAIFALVILLASTPVQAQDVEGSKDHPMFSRMPGYVIVDYDAQDFSTLDLPTDPARKVEGKYWRISYGLPEGAKKAGPVQTARNYTNLVIQRGGRKLSDDVSAGGGTTVAQLPLKNGKSLWLQVEINNAGEGYTLYVVEEAEMEQLVEFTAQDLLATLRSKGSVALHNILFDTGKATLKAESSTALSPVGEALKTDGTLKVEIQGHTDKVGSAASNLKLSQERAATVRTYLIETFGIEGSRLTAVGLGDTRPVGDNATEEGRAKNRRVELVKK